MSITEYWDSSDPSLYWAYRTSFILGEQRKLEADNFDAWLSGLYICEAVSVAINNNFNDVKRSYMEKPIDFAGINKKAKEDKRKVMKDTIESKVKSSISIARSRLQDNKQRKE